MTAWMDSALCATNAPDLFFSDSAHDSVRARKICAACPVRRECFDYAVAGNEEFGVCAGFSAREIRKMVRDAA